MNRHRIARRARRIGETGVIYLLTWQDLRAQVRAALQQGLPTRQEATREVVQRHPAWRQGRNYAAASGGAAFALARLLGQAAAPESPERSSITRWG